MLSSIFVFLVVLLMDVIKVVPDGFGVAYMTGFDGQFSFSYLTSCSVK